MILLLKKFELVLDVERIWVYKPVSVEVLDPGGVLNESR